METPQERETPTEDFAPNEERQNSEDDRENAAVEARAEAPIDLKDMAALRNRLLLVDDDLEFERVLDGLASRLSCAMVTANDFQSFQRALADFDPEVIVLSLKIKDRDGVELLRYLAEKRWIGPLLLVGNWDIRLLEATERLARVRRLNVHASLQKPIPMGGLRSALGNLLNTRPGISEYELKEGLKRGEFMPFFQPMIDLTGEKGIVGVELLARWNHPFHGILPASDFIDIAERCGIAADMTARLLEQALREAGKWRHEDQSLPLSLNISAKSLMDLKLPETLADIVARHGLENSMITLELTESAMTEQEPEILDNLTRFRMKGFRLSMDDFGTGYSTLLELIRLPFDEIKIDRRFVQHLGSRREADIVIGSTVALAHGLDMKVCAEGVEDQKTLDYLRIAGCDAAQGRWIQEPISGHDLELCLKELEADRNLVHSDRTHASVPQHRGRDEEDLL